jgi:sortase A
MNYLNKGEIIVKRRLRGIILIVAGIIILSIINYGRFNVYRIQQQMKKSVLHNLDAKGKNNEELSISELSISELSKVDKTEQLSEDKGQGNDVQNEKLREGTISAKNENNLNETNIGEPGVEKDVEKSIYENCIGVLSIPKIALEVAVSEGVTMENLRYSVSHYSNTAAFGEKGNCCIAGHRSYAYNEFFSRLNEINKGDYIYVETAGNKFTYKVYDVFTVEPTEIGVLDNSEDCELTLITCTPIRVATHRLIIKGKLVEK